jgi:DinB superfamily
VHPQLQAVIDEFLSAQERLHRLKRTVPEPEWTRRADPKRWSMAECIGHLNLTAEAYLPLLWGAIQRGQGLGRSSRRRYSRDPIGWFLWRIVGPPVRHRTQTIASFMPAANAPLPALLAEFDRLQTAQVDCVRAADGLELGRMWITSPFDRRIRYNAYSCFTILSRHEHRHLWQAEQVWSALQQKGSV